MTFILQYCINDIFWFSYAIISSRSNHRRKVWDSFVFRCKLYPLRCALFCFIARHQLSGHATQAQQIPRDYFVKKNQLKRNQGITSGILSYQNGITPAYLVFQAIAILPEFSNPIIIIRLKNKRNRWHNNW